MQKYNIKVWVQLSMVKMKIFYLNERKIFRKDILSKIYTKINLLRFGKTYFKDNFIDSINGIKVKVLFERWYLLFNL